MLLQTLGWRLVIDSEEPGMAREGGIDQREADFLVGVGG